MPSLLRHIAWWGSAMGAMICLTGRSAAAETNDLLQEFGLLRRQNEELRQQLQRQQELIDQLQKEMIQLQEASRRSTRESPMTPDEGPTPPLGPSSLLQPFKSENLALSGQGGVVFFHQGREGQFRYSEFHIDDAKLFLEAKIWEDIYLFSELNVLTREELEEYLRIGELYVDFENVSKLWNRERLLNLRVGRFDIPFGEEYQTRDVLDNPLIMHSLSDLWGVDEGLELYGAAGRFQYALAVQNGGHPVIRDYDADKAVAGRLGYDPAKWLHVSASAMRTGNLDVKSDKFSEIWFGNGFFKQLGTNVLNTKFQANLFEGDVQFRWPRGHLKGAGGYVFFDDNDPAADHQRDIYYYYVEGVRDVTRKLYAASRFSQIMAPGGYHLVGNGNFGRNVFNVLTEDLWRLSLGLGYRFNPNFVVKVEYSLSRGRELYGRRREKEDSFGIEIGYRF
ncbi:MAG: hypothetical protein HY674_11760 [Chloroflexi bacterium]|nr:hypothetical protein [Chloroflexota bacterium]